MVYSSSFSAQRPPTREQLYGQSGSSIKIIKPPPFLRNLKITLIILRFSGLFPFEMEKMLHIKNVPSFIVNSFVGCMSLYKIVLELVPSFIAMFTNWDAAVGVDFGVSLYFCMKFACVIFVVSLGYGKKLERFSELLSFATDQKGLEIHYKGLSKKHRILQVILTLAALLNIGIYLALVLVPSITEIMPVAVKKFKNLFGTSDLSHLLTLVWAPLGYLTLYTSAFLYWTCCKCLRLEFEQISEDITECSLKKPEQLQAIALKHCRLLKCLDYLHDIFALYVMCMFAGGSLIATLFSYVILQRETDFGFRLLAVYWLFLTAWVNCILCLTAEALHESVKEARQKVCSHIAEELDVDDQVFDVGNMICEQTASDVRITAFGFFTVSKELLLSIYSFIATYVVILLQTPPAFSNTQIHASNATSFIQTTIGY